MFKKNTKNKKQKTNKTKTGQCEQEHNKILKKTPCFYKSNKLNQRGNSK